MQQCLRLSVAGGGGQRDEDGRTEPRAGAGEPAEGGTTAREQFREAAVALQRVAAVVASPKTPATHCSRLGPLAASTGRPWHWNQADPEVRGPSSRVSPSTAQQGSVPSLRERVPRLAPRRHLITCTWLHLLHLPPLACA